MNNDELIEWLLEPVGRALMSTTEILDRLNEYVGDNVWGDFIATLPLNHEATAAADPSSASDVFFLVDGTEFRFDYRVNGWVVV